jgi:hypothetical protein
VIDHACVRLCVLRTGASLLIMGCQVVAIHCDRFGCLSGEDGAWTSGGFGCGLFHGNICCRERESSKKSNRVSTIGEVGMACTLGDVTGNAGSGSVSGGTLGGVAGVI